MVDIQRYGGFCYLLFTCRIFFFWFSWWFMTFLLVIFWCVPAIIKDFWTSWRLLPSLGRCWRELSDKLALRLSPWLASSKIHLLYCIKGRNRCVGRDPIHPVYCSSLSNLFIYTITLLLNCSFMYLFKSCACCYQHSRG